MTLWVSPLQFLSSITRKEGWGGSEFLDGQAVVRSNLARVTIKTDSDQAVEMNLSLPRGRKNGSISCVFLLDSILNLALGKILLLAAAEPRVGVSLHKQALVSSSKEA